MVKTASLFSFVIAVLGAVFLLEKHFLFSKNIIAIMIQVFAACLMVWARITLGFRSFHPTANTTKGNLVTTGPYRWLRHPVYASLIYFIAGSVISFPNLETTIAFVVIAAALFTRMILEEKFLLHDYPEYLYYMRRTKRVIPFLL